MMFCSKCGAQNPDDSKFCAKCGATLNGATPQETAQPAPLPPWQPPTQKKRKGCRTALFIGLGVVGLWLLVGVIGLIVENSNDFSNSTSSSSNSNSSSGNNSSSSSSNSKLSDKIQVVSEKIDDFGHTIIYVKNISNETFDAWDDLEFKVTFVDGTSDTDYSNLAGMEPGDMRKVTITWTSNPVKEWHFTN